MAAQNLAVILIQVQLPLAQLPPYKHKYSQG